MWRYNLKVTPLNTTFKFCIDSTNVRPQPDHNTNQSLQEWRYEFHNIHFLRLPES